MPILENPILPEEIESTCSFQEKSRVTNSIFKYDRKASIENVKVNSISFEKELSDDKKISKKEITES